MEERIRQRRALYTVLRQWLDENNLLEALQVFEDQFQGQPTIAVNDYLNRIAPLYRDRVDAKTLRHNLMQLLVRKSAQLEPDPLPLLQQLRARTESVALEKKGAQATAEQLALHTLVSNMMRKLAQHQRKQVHAAIALQLKQHFVNGSYDALARYLLTDNPLHLALFDDRSLRQFFNLIYVAACEVLGPTSADRWFGSCIAQLRETDRVAGDAVNRYL
ncbi:MAG TPA: hypothetical protein VFX11_18125 [Candidatus Kapabacteria bacterium]|nr:hypothetical protein [Candidatus Kapabacteria bacterium]